MYHNYQSLPYTAMLTRIQYYNSYMLKQIPAQASMQALVRLHLLVFERALSHKGVPNPKNSQELL